MDNLSVTFLEMHGQPPEAVARQLAAFIEQAQVTIDWAAYDLHLTGPAHDLVLAALHRRADAGVAIRLVYESDAMPTAPPFENSRPPSDTVEFVRELGYPARPIRAWCCLMHHKYIVIDGHTPQGQVWTGSTNFTDSSWSLQENNILTIASAPVALGYVQDFEELWTRRTMVNTGKRDVDPLRLTYAGAPLTAEIHFSPGQGKWINREIALRVAAARERITICAAVMTSGQILGALREVMDRKLPMDGVYDAGQMAGVYPQWDREPGNEWKTELFHDLIRYGHLVGKPTTPWSPTSVHDFMHNKILVVDDTVITGSYNFSRNAETNAENVLFLTSPALAATYRATIAHLAQRYGGGVKRET